MKIFQAFVLLLITAVFSWAFAESPSFLSNATSLQSYQSANTAHPSASNQVNASGNQVVQSQEELQVARDLKSQLNDLNQALLLFQENTNEKMEKITTQNLNLQENVKKLTQAMLMMNQQISQMNHSKTISKVTQANTKKHFFNQVLKYLPFGLTTILAVLLGILITRQKGSVSV